MNVRLLSNELEGRGASEREETMGFLIIRQDSPNSVQRTGVFVAPVRYAYTRETGFPK